MALYLDTFSLFFLFFEKEVMEPLFLYCGSFNFLRRKFCYETSIDSEMKAEKSRKTTWNQSQVYLSYLTDFKVLMFLKYWLISFRSVWKFWSEILLSDDTWRDIMNKVSQHPPIVFKIMFCQPRQWVGTYNSKKLFLLDSEIDVPTIFHLYIIQ